MIGKYENNNELIIFWSIGIRKIEFANILLKFSIFYLIFQLALTTFIVPFTLDKARSYIRGSNVDLFSSIVQEKKFVDTVKNLTIFVDEKDINGNLKNIFLKEKIGENEHQIIVAKEGKIKKINSNNILMLFNGKIINNNKKTTNSFKFSKTEVNLSKFTTKTTTYPKIQEIRTYDIVTCIVKLKNFHNTFLLNFFKTKRYLTNCRKENITSPFQEIFKRFISSFYLPVLSLIACLVIIKSKDDYEYIKYKFILFMLGVVAIIISETSVKYFSDKLFPSVYLSFLPILLFMLIYMYLKIKLKKNKLINQ